jgi:hypothetical protein
MCQRFFNVARPETFRGSAAKIGRLANTRVDASENGTVRHFGSHRPQKAPPGTAPAMGRQ